MSRFLNRASAAALCTSLLLAAQPALADVTNLICRYPGYQGVQQLQLLWIDPNSNTVYEVFSIGIPGTPASVDDALARAGRGELKEFHATITPTGIAWTDSHGAPWPTQINRMSGLETWSNLPNSTGQCEKGDVPFPAAKF